MTIILDSEGLAIPMVSRAGTGFDEPRGCPSSSFTYTDLVVHYTAGNRPKSREREISAALVVQDFHFSLGWTDFAYNFYASQWDGLNQARGFGCRNGANTPKNSSTLSIVLFGSTDLQPNDVELNAILDLAEYLDLAPSACPGGCLISGHYDISPTSCPGPWFAEWRDAGFPRPDDLLTGC